FQDVLVLERAPRDIEGVPAAVVTAEPQGELSHLAVRTARRGTPNAFVAGAAEAFGVLEGRLVRLEVRSGDYAVEPAAPEEAEAWWAAARPRLEALPEVDAAYGAFDALEDMDLSGAAVAPEARYGGKASHLARLQRVLEGPFERYREAGFSVPVRHYLEFLRSNRIASLADPGRQVTYAEHIEEILADPGLATDSGARFEALARLRAAMEEEGVLPAGLAARIAARAAEVFGTTGGMVRLRSSSNAEDLLEFNGAGLYASASACAADDLDGDGVGPSRCDGRLEDERSIARALKRVWASLWSFRAYEERAYYGIPQERVAMGVLVTRAFRGERANGVAFTGNPANPADRRYVVVAQPGEASVVSPEPGTVAEKDVLEMSEGKVVRIVRAQASSLLPPGGRVLSDAMLEELGALLAHMDRSFPVEVGAHRREEVLLDVELKVEGDGSLAVKQVRPFLAAGRARPAVAFELVVPEGTEACGAFVEGRAPREAYELKGVLRLRAGRLVLSTREERSEAELFEAVLVGPSREAAAPVGPGVFAVDAREDGGITRYRFAYEQRFRLGGDRELTLRVPEVSFEARGALPVEAARTLDGEELARLGLEGELGGKSLRFTSCAAASLPLWEIAADLEDGTRVRLLERHRPPRDLLETGPASLVRAELDLRDERREVDDYWRLVYAAQRHNRAVRHWVVLDPPAVVPGLERVVRAVELIAPEPAFGIAAAASYLDESFEPIASLAVSSYARSRVEEPGEARFVRGDADASGKRDLGDAVAVLLHLFQGGAAPSCLDAADLDDGGTLDLTDAVRLLLHLFRGGEPPPEPFGACGLDPTADGLACAEFAACGG
ncbi:MAG: hypothetical protein HY721_02305, partial [Planctomycetes bacterium]|nr:hypothetical protein [Planctomycetota bacterium]